MEEEKFWKLRARKYNQLEWVNDETYLSAFIKVGNFREEDLVLDVGTGTGIVAHAISSLVKEVIGLDISQDMLEHSNWDGNKYFVRRDVREPIFADNVFDKVTARMVFHHILEGTQAAMNECYRVLKPGGKIILSEGIPPNQEVREDYERIFRLKEERLTFYEEDLIRLLENAGFKNIEVTLFEMKNSSVKKWLNSDDSLSQENRDKIFDLYLNSKPYFKEAYNLKVKEGDCFIDVKYAILVGEKC